jgi:hypothetical protein
MMRKSVLIASLAVLIMFAAVSSSTAANQFTISINGGYTFSWAELELEYKMDNVGLGAQVGFGLSRFEIAAFGRYYFPLNGALNLAPEFELALYGGVTASALLDILPSFAAGLGLKVGPGIDFRWSNFRVGAELGYRFDTIWGITHDFYVKGGIGYRF